jgi:hypothetical protein
VLSVDVVEAVVVGYALCDSDVPRGMSYPCSSLFVPDCVL